MKNNNLEERVRLNYYALLACIINKKLTVESSLDFLGLGGRKLKNCDFSNLEVHDIKLGKVYKCSSKKEVFELIGIKECKISVYIQKGIRFKNRYKIIRK